MEPKLESTPRLRFTDDNNEPYPEWGEKRLGDVGKWKSNSGFAKKHINPEGANSLILYGELYTKYDGKAHINKIDSRTSEISTRSVSPGDLLFPSSGETKSQIIRCLTVSKKNDTPIYTSGDLLILSPSNEFSPYSLFISSYINSPSLNRKMRAKAQGNSVVHMSKGAWENCSIPLPSLPEQEKIGEFLSSLDTEVEQAERLVSLLSDRKKAYAQRIFDRTLRFHDDNDNPYPEWEERKLGELFNIRSGRNKTHYATGDFLDLTMGSVSREGKMIPKGRTNDKKDLLYKDELITPTRAVDRGGKIIGLTLVIEEDNKYTAGNCTFVLSKTMNNVDSKYASLAINTSSKTRRQVIMNTTGTSQMMINKDPYMSVSIPLPSLPEQEKIGSFLSALDDEIDQAKRELELLKEQKKAYAQRIFGV